MIDIIKNGSRCLQMSTADVSSPPKTDAGACSKWHQLFNTTWLSGKLKL